MWTESDGRGHTFDSNTGFKLLDSSMRSPDAAWISKQRVDTLSEAESNRFGRICPEILIELRSSSDRLADLEAKMEQWLANEVKLTWLIDPQEKRVTIYRTGKQPESLEEPAAVTADGPVSGFVLTM